MTGTEDYPEKFVAFADILGFAELVRKAGKDADLRQRIITALRQVAATAAPREEQESGLRIQNFSDSLILSANNTVDGIWHLLLTLDALSWNLLNIDVLVRGAVTLGRLHHDPSIVFGEGVIEAYRLETTVAKFPRIVLSRSAWEQLQLLSSIDEMWIAMQTARLKRDRDGVVFINFLNEMAAANYFLKSGAAKGVENSPWIAQGKAVRDQIQKQIDDTIDSPTIFEKIEWLANYWNQTVVGSKDENDCFVGRVKLPGDIAIAVPLPFRPNLDN